MSGRRLHRQLVGAVLAQIGLLAILALGSGVGLVGSLVGLGVMIITVVLLARALPADRGLGPANLVTLARTVLVGGVCAMVASGLASGGPQIPVLVAIGTVALIMDGVDGRVARRSGSVSAVGARFDMEIDSVLVLALSVQVAQTFGIWVLLIGLMRYLWIAAGAVWPWLRGDFPSRLVTKSIAVLQAVVLLLAISGWVPQPVAAALLGLALALLIWSFVSSGRWLWLNVRGQG